MRTVTGSQLVVVAEFGDPIYPGLTHLGSIHRGGDKPAHLIINGENHHVLEALQFTHARKVDCIYIDPPYKAGPRDWKYNNNYVDESDSYRHSKWLAFMERLSIHSYLSTCRSARSHSCSATGRYARTRRRHQSNHPDHGRDQSY